MPGRCTVRKGQCQACGDRFVCCTGSADGTAAETSAVRGGQTADPLSGDAGHGILAQGNDFLHLLRCSAHHPACWNAGAAGGDDHTCLAAAGDGSD